MRLAFALALALACILSKAADPIPPQLVGIWVSETAPRSSEGNRTNVYLGADGVGAIVAGSPPIGFKILATFNATTNAVDFDAYEGKTRGFHGQLRYDPKEKTLDFATHRDVMRRKSETFSERDRKEIGLQ